MSLQVCYCGWSKVTSVHGLRTHQGIKGCTPKSVKIAQSDQQYFVGAPAIQLDVKLEVRTSIKTDTTDYYSDLSLQVCHCGWSKMTTYQGLRIHQGKMGCTPKGMRIPKEEQYKWNKQQEAEVDRRKMAERVVVKKESLSPRRRSSTNSAATTVQEGYMPPSAAARRSSQRSTKSKSDQQQFSSLHQVNRPVREHPTPTYPERDKKIKRQTSSRNTDSRAVEYCSIDSNTGYVATVKEEPKSPFAVSQPSFQRDTKSMSRQKLQDLSTDVKMNRDVKEPPTLVPVVWPRQKHRESQTFSQVNRQLVREHPTSMHLGNVVRPKEEKLQNQILSQNTDSRAVEGYWSIKSSSSNATTAAALKEEPKLYPQPSLQRATESSHQMQDSSTDAKVNKMVSEPPNAPPLVPAVPPTDNSRKEPTPSQMNRSVREHPKTPPLVLSKKKDTLLFKVRQEKITSELQQKLQKREEELTGIRTVEPVCESVEDATSANTQTAPAAAEVSAKEDSASLNEAAQPDFSTGMTVKELSWMFSASTDQEPKNEGGKQKPSQVKLLARGFSASTVREAVVQPKEKDKNKQGVEEGKLLAPGFLASTARETAVQPQENDKEEQQLSQNEPPSINSATAAKVTEEAKPSVTTQCSLTKVSNIQGNLQLKVNRSVRKHPTAPPPVLPKKDALLFKGKEGAFKSELQQKHQEEKATDRPAETVHEKVADTVNTNTQVSAKEDPPSLNEDVPDFSTGMKVKELARMFSGVTDQKPKNDKVEQKPSQTKLLAQRFSALTASKTAIQPKEKDKEAQAKVPAPRFSASTVRETVGKPKQNDGEKHKLPQKQLPNATDVATRMNPAATEPTVEKDPKSSCETAQLSDVCTGVKVKDLIRMFSATTTQETDVQTEEKKREQNLHRW